jgi:Highly conserved protein containing a thioredoxin domain
MKIILIIFLFPLLSIAQDKQHSFTQAMKSEMMEKVRSAAKHGWEGYKKYAWGADDLKPLTREPRTWYKTSMLMTPVDAFDTFILLDLKEEATDAKKLILTRLDFNVDQEVQVFEITIRLLAGLLTAYQLDGDKQFLVLAVDLGNRLMPCFQSATGMPYRYVNLRTGKTRDSANNPAEIGTLMMEFGMLSKITHDDRYYNAAKKAILGVYNRRSSIGLVGEIIDANTGKWLSTQSHVSGYIDSYYEYLYKSWRLFGDKDFRIAWDHSAAAIKKYLVVKLTVGWFCRHVDMNTGHETKPYYGALDAFIAGLMTYSGDVATGIQMQKANYYMWTHYNMEPEEFNFRTGEVYDSSYSLRPENLESCFYLYRKTRNDAYLFMGKRMVDDILTHCYTPDGYAALKSIFTFEKRNSMESFFFGETLKYAYLIFAPDQKLNLDKVVLTTEAHPFSRQTLHK